MFMAYDLIILKTAISIIHSVLQVKFVFLGVTFTLMEILIILVFGAILCLLIGGLFR